MKKLFNLLENLMVLARSELLGATADIQFYKTYIQTFYKYVGTYVCTCFPRVGFVENVKCIQKNLDLE